MAFGKVKMPARIRALSFLATVLLLTSCGGGVRVAPSLIGVSVPPNAPIDETRLVTLAGNVPLQARIGIDEGVIDAGTRLDRMLLTLESSPAQQAALK